MSQNQNQMSLQVTNKLMPDMVNILRKIRLLWDHQRDPWVMCNHRKSPMSDIVAQMLLANVLAALLSSYGLWTKSELDSNNSVLHIWVFSSVILSFCVSLYIKATAIWSRTYLMCRLLRSCPYSFDRFLRRLCNLLYYWLIPLALCQCLWEEAYWSVVPDR